MQYSLSCMILLSGISAQGITIGGFLFPVYSERDKKKETSSFTYQVSVRALQQDKLRLMSSLLCSIPLHNLCLPARITRVILNGLIINETAPEMRKGE